MERVGAFPTTSGLGAPARTTRQDMRWREPGSLLGASAQPTYREETDNRIAAIGQKNPTRLPARASRKLRHLLDWHTCLLRCTSEGLLDGGTCLQVVVSHYLKGFSKIPFHSNMERQVAQGQTALHIHARPSILAERINATGLGFDLNRPPGRAVRAPPAHRRAVGSSFRRATSRWRHTAVPRPGRSSARQRLFLLDRQTDQHEPVDLIEVPVVGHQIDACLQRVRCDPDVVRRNRAPLGS